MSEPMAPKLAVVIPTHNRRDYVLDTLDSLGAQTLAPDAFEVVVVCDGDVDSTVAALSAATTPFPLKVVLQPQSGPAAARNHGAAESRGEVVLFLDDDVLAVPRLLAEHLESHDGHPDRVVVGRLLPDPTIKPRGWTLWEQRNFDQRYGVLDAGLRPVDGRKFYSGNVSVDRAAFDAVGGFDVSYSRAEDIELGYRLQRWGAELCFNGRAACIHRGVHSFRGWREIQYTYGRCDVMMSGAHPIPFGRWYQDRNLLNRVACRAALGRPRVRAGLVWAWRLLGGSAVRLPAAPIARWSYSAIANLQYWQGVADELGGEERLWALLGAPAVAAR